MLENEDPDRVFRQHGDIMCTGGQQDWRLKEE